MPADPHHRDVEARFIQLIEDAELPRPDRIEFEPDSVIFFWDGPKTAVVVDLDPDGSPA